MFTPDNHDASGRLEFVIQHLVEMCAGIELFIPPQIETGLCQRFGQLLDAAWTGGDCRPQSSGAAQAAAAQGGINDRQRGDPAADTADFNDATVGNLRLDYLVPSANLEVTGCGVFWPAEGEDGHDLAGVSDHRLVWLDIRL